MNNNLNPYNDVNKKITYFNINNILNRVDMKLKINNLETYQSSLLHKSYTYKNNYEYNNSETKIIKKPNNCIELFNIDSYENLEFLGDRVIDLSAVEYLFKRFHNRANEGFMTKLKIKLVKKDTLATYSKYLKLDDHLIISRYLEINNGRKNIRILEDVFEAFIGAVFLDNGIKGYEICNKIMNYIFDNLIDWEQLILEDTNYKDILLRYYQKTYKIYPKYVELEKNENNFVIGIIDENGNIIGKGESLTKREAEQLASKETIEYLNIV